MIYGLITAVILLSLYAGVGTFFTAYFYGQTTTLRRFLISLARDKRRLERNVLLWSGKVVQSRGLGTLTPGPPSNKSHRATNIVAPSQVIEELKQVQAKMPAIQSHPVPPQIKRDFLAEAQQLQK